MTIRTLSYYPQPCSSKSSMLPSPTKLLSPPHPTHLFSLHSMHQTMENHSLPEHPNTTGTIMMGNSILRTNYTSLKLPNMIWYHPSMQVRPVDMAVYFAPSTYSNRTFGGQGWLPMSGNMLLDVLFAKQTKSTPIPPSWPSLPEFQLYLPFPTGLCGPYYRPTPQWILWLSHGCSRPWTYEGGNSLPLQQKYWHSRCSQTLFPPCFLSLQLIWQMHLWLRPSIHLSLARELTHLLKYDLKLSSAYHP